MHLFFTVVLSPFTISESVATSATHPSQTVTVRVLRFDGKFLNYLILLSLDFVFKYVLFLKHQLLLPAVVALLLLLLAAPLLHLNLCTVSFDRE